MKIIILVALTLSFCSFSHAELYSWIDENGGVVISQEPKPTKNRPSKDIENSSPTASNAKKKLPQRIINFEAPGNLKPTKEIGCVKSSKITNKYTPADLYRGLAVCFKTDDYKNGAFIFALAGVYGRFDTLRVSDKSAHQAMSVLQMQIFNSVDKNKSENMRAAIKIITEDPKKLHKICEEIKKIGSPTYYPRYMVQHGIKAFTGGSANNGLNDDFDAQAAWAKSLDTYLHCPEIIQSKPVIPPTTEQTGKQQIIQSNGQNSMTSSQLKKPMPTGSAEGIAEIKKTPSLYPDNSCTQKYESIGKICASQTKSIPVLQQCIKEKLDAQCMEQIKAAQNSLSEVLPKCTEVNKEFMEKQMKTCGLPTNHNGKCYEAIKIEYELKVREACGGMQ